jgi:GMP reductase
MLIEDDVKFDYSDVLIRPKRSTLTSRFDVEMERTYNFYHSQKNWTGVPIMASNMDTTGTFNMHAALSKHKMVTCIARHYNKNYNNWSDKEHELSKLRLMHSCVMSGISKQELTELVHIAKMFPVSFVGLDVANGYTKNFVDAVSRVRESLPDSTIIAGNVVTGDMTSELLMAGADIIKVGVGPGSVCTTRIKTGIGYPQLSAVIECADAAHGIGGHIIADGGCNSSGDIVKAFAAGADFVMIGGMLAGHDECDGELVFEDDVEEPVGMKFYGMASNTAMERHGHPNREYRGEEGKTVTVPYRGAVDYTVLDILGGIRSACTYVGAKRLKDLTKCATFVKVYNTHNRVYE